MKVKRYKTIYGIEDVQKISDLVAYANRLASQYGEDTEYSCGGYEFQEIIILMVEESPEEKLKRENIEGAYTTLRGCRVPQTHRDVIALIGESEYQKVINKLNEEKQK